MATHPNNLAGSTAVVNVDPPMQTNLGVTVVATKTKDQEYNEEQEFLDLAHERFRLVCMHEGDWRQDAERELEFVSGKHWQEAQLKERAGRPSLTFDLIGPSIDQVVNDARQNPPEPRISPVGDGADKDEAEIIQGMIRNIDNDSRADIAYLTAYEYAVSIGRGWWRINYVYENNRDFKQKVLIKRIQNPFSVYVDPATEEFDYSDMRYCFVTEDIDEAVFKEMYPHSKAASGDFSGVGDQVKNRWFPQGAIRVAEYWWIETSEQYICQLQDGSIVPWDQVPEGVIPVNTRSVDKRQVKVAKITGNEILEQKDWPGKWIPLIPCLGKEIMRNKRRELRGMIRPAMDANLSYDYMRSKQVEAVALAPIAPWMAAEGQIEGYEQNYADANRKPINYLLYKTKDAEGNQFAQPPMRQIVSPDIQAITVGVQFAKQDCQSQLATYDPSLGAPSPDASGRAISYRQRESDNAHFNYHDNLARSIRHTGRIIVDLIPIIYSEPRVVGIVDPDGTMRTVQINQKHLYQGIEKLFDLSHAADRYDVVVGSGPSYATKRQMAVDAYTELVKANPQAMAPTLDIGLRMMDIPQADQMADRLRPPNAQTDAQGNPIQIPPQIQAQLQQSSQLMQAQTQEIHRLSGIIEKQVLKLESDERRNLETVRGNIIVAEINAKSKEADTLANVELEGAKQRLNALHTGVALDQEAARMQQDQDQHDAEMQLQQQQLQQSANPPGGSPQGGGTQ